MGSRRGRTGSKRWRGARGIRLGASWLVVLALTSCSSPTSTPAPSIPGAASSPPGAPSSHAGAPPAGPAGPPPHAPPGKADVVGRFGAVIPEDFPDFMGGIDGTEFVPDPFFYGEESWDGLELRLQLYLLYNHKDLARLALRRGDAAAALAWYDRLLETLRASPIESGGPEPILLELHRALIHFAERARVPLLIRDGRLEAAETALSALGPSTHPADRAWTALMTGALALARGDHRRAAETLAAARDASLEQLDGPPWQPGGTGAAPSQLERHRDRLSRLEAYARWSSPLSPRLVWGTWEPIEAVREAWAYAIAAAMALEHPGGAGAAGGVPPERSLAGLLGRVKVESRLRLEPGRLEPATGDPLTALERAEAALRLDLEAAPRTSIELLQGMPTGDSFVDLLGEPGAPPVGRLERLSITDPGYRAWIEGYVREINEALAAGRIDELAGVVDELVRELEARPFKSRYYNLKRLRNEAIRLLVLAGRPDAALRMLEGFYPLGGIDYRCPNRTGILKAAKVRILLEAGRLEEASAALEAALEDTRRWRGYLERYRARFPARRGGPPGGPGAGGGPGAPPRR